MNDFNWKNLRNTNRTTPVNMTDMALATDLSNMQDLQRAGRATNGDRDRILDLTDEITRREANATRGVNHSTEIHSRYGSYREHRDNLRAALHDAKTTVGELSCIIHHADEDELDAVVREMQLAVRAINKAMQPLVDSMLDLSVDH